MEESIHIVFDKTNDLPSRKREGADDVDIIEEGMKELTINDQLKEKHEDKSINDQNVREQPQGTSDLSKE